MRRRTEEPTPLPDTGSSGVGQLVSWASVLQLPYMVSVATITRTQVAKVVLFSVGVNIALRPRSLGVSSNSNWRWSSRITGSFRK